VLAKAVSCTWALLAQARLTKCARTATDSDRLHARAKSALPCIMQCPPTLAFFPLPAGPSCCSACLVSRLNLPVLHKDAHVVVALTPVQLLNWCCSVGPEKSKANAFQPPTSFVIPYTHLNNPCFGLQGHCLQSMRVHAGTFRAAAEANAQWCYGLTHYTWARAPTQLCAQWAPALGPLTGAAVMAGTARTPCTQAPPPPCAGPCLLSGKVTLLYLLNEGSLAEASGQQPELN